jgi:hypothetical protein
VLVGRLRRFALVALVFAGALSWGSLPLHRSYPTIYVVAGFVAAILSAGVPWAPRFATRRLVRIAFAGWLSFGLLELVALASKDLAGLGALPSGNMWAFVTVWLLGVGIVAQLVIVECRPLDVYAGLVAMFAFVAPFAGNQQHGWGAAVFGIALLGLVSLVSAVITRALQRAVTRKREVELPDARVVTPEQR